MPSEPKEMSAEEIKAKIRRSAAYLQGVSTKYFNDRDKLDAIRFLYRKADQSTKEPQ